MGYADFLRQMLKPMGVYRLNDGYSAAEIEAVGDALDKVSAKLGAYLSGSTYAESGGDYLKMLESLFPIALSMHP